MASNPEERLRNIIKIIESEAEDQAHEIEQQTKEKCNSIRNKAFATMREQLINEFNKKRENEEVRVKTERSRCINESRLEIQQKRADLLSTLKDDIRHRLEAKLRDPAVRKEALKKLIVQGLVRLLEKQVIIRCKQEDEGLVKQALDDVKREFKDFLKKELNRELDISLEVSDKYLEKGESEIGGVILYCNNNKIVYKNTFDMRLDLSFLESVPDIRAGIFGVTEKLVKQAPAAKTHH